MSIDVQPGADIMVRQASATQLYRCQARGVKLQADIHVAAGARFSYSPLELIPHQDADYQQKLRIFLDEGAKARLTEVVSPGRLCERFGYRRLELHTEVFLAGRRILLDLQRIVPRETDCRLLLGEHTHFGTLLDLGPHIDASGTDRLHARFAEQGVLGSASVLPAYGIGARVVGGSADSLFRALSAPS
jgi:urease accessory protein UreH